MLAWVLHRTNGPEGYTLTEVDTPEPGPGQVRVRLRAAALNHLDLWVSRGLPQPELPHVAGADGAGTVEAIGEGVRGMSEGEEVVINPSISCGQCRACLSGDAPLCPTYSILGEHRWGTFAEAVVVPQANVTPKPGNLPWVEAAAYGLCSATALRMLRRARLSPGDLLLVVGAGGGVSSAALMLGLAMGATVYVTSTSPRKIERAIELGASEGFDSKDEFAASLKATGTAGADVVVENVGRATWDQSLRSLRPGGRLVTCGGTSGTTVALELPRLFFKQIEVIGSTMFDYQEFDRATTLVAQGRVPVIVDEVFPFERLPEALARLDSGEQFGKVVVSHGPPIP